MLGEAAPVSEPVATERCAVCGRGGTLRYETFPLRSREALGVDLCSLHFRDLLGRKLTATAFHNLCRQIRRLGLDSGDVFLLHEAFYDAQGRALHPIETAD